MVVTLLTSQDEISPLKEEALRNMFIIVVAELVFHDETFSLNVLTVEQYE